MSKILNKIYDSGYGFIFFMCFVACWVVGADFTYNFFSLKQLHWDFGYFLFVFFMPFALFTFLKDKLDDDNLKRKIAKLEKEIGEQEASDKLIIDGLNERFHFVARNLKYYIQDDTFMMCLDGLKDGELEILKTIEIANNKQSFIGDNALFELSSGYKIKIYHNRAQAVQVSLENGIGSLLLFNFTPFNKLVYKRNEDEIRESIDLMLLRVNHIFVDFIGAKEFPEVRYLESTVNHKGENR